MAINIGSAAPHDAAQDVLARARARAALIPDLLVQARQIANTVTSGWHGRKRRGSGDAFWQFRPYSSGESMARIDWRRSARDDSVYIRDQEWEAAHTVWVWADESPSMLYQSENATVSKQSRAFVLALALAETLARGGERVGWPGETNPIAHRNAAERIAAQLSVVGPSAPNTRQRFDAMRSRSQAVLFSDFLAPIDETLEDIAGLAQRGIRGTLVQIIDPAEETFPFLGRTEFRDPETARKITFGRAESVKSEYATLFQARKERLARRCVKFGWHHIVHHTDQPASRALVALHLRLSEGAGELTA